jgi:hypothetical protein
LAFHNKQNDDDDDDYHTKVLLSGAQSCFWTSVRRGVKKRTKNTKNLKLKTNWICFVVAGPTPDVDFSSNVR